MTGQGGWPMTVFLMPDGRPFFGGTYFPKTARGNMLSFTDLLRRIDDVWRTRRDDLDVAGRATSPSRSAAAAQLPDPRRHPRPRRPGRRLRRPWPRQFDPEWGGFGHAPKFPQTMSLEFLLRAHAHNGSAETLAMVTTSLDAMASGGIYDHLGGGFARYSVDERVAGAALREDALRPGPAGPGLPPRLAGHRRARYRQVLDETIEYVTRDLRHRGGGFYSAEDADSLDPDGHTEEGRFYTWTPAELDRGARRRWPTVAAEWWGVTEGGNFEGRIDPAPAGAGRPAPARRRRAGPPRAVRRARGPAPSRPRRQGADRVERADAGHAGRGRPRHRQPRAGSSTPCRRPSSCSSNLRTARRALAALVAGRPRRRPT